jgi:hypothetical protein
VPDNSKDLSRVSVNEASEVTYWCQKFGCSETQLRTAAKMVGVTVSKVRYRQFVSLWHERLVCGRCRQGTRRLRRLRFR